MTIDKIEEINVVHFLEILLRDVKNGTHQKEVIAPLVEDLYNAMRRDGML